MTEEHAKNIYHAFRTQGHMDVCNTCHCVRTCIAHIADLTNECFNCCIKRLTREEEEKKKEARHVPLDLEDFCK